MMKFRRLIWIRTLRFVAFHWWLPFMMGVITAIIVESHFAYELALAIDEVYSNAHSNP